MNSITIIIYIYNILYCSIFNRYFSRAFPYDHNHNEAFFCRQKMVKKMLKREKTHKQLPRWDF